MDITERSRIVRSPLSSGGAILLVADTAYFVYMGFVRNPITVKYVECYVTLAGAGAQVAEVGLFSSPSVPKKANQSLTKLVSTATVDSVLGAAVIRNTNSFDQVITPGTFYLWAGIRTNMAITQPTLRALNDDMGHGMVLATAAAGVLTAAGPWTGALVAAAVFQGAPDLRITLD